MKRLLFLFLLWPTVVLAASTAQGHRNCTGTAALVGTMSGRTWLAVINRDTTNDVCLSSSSSAAVGDATAGCLGPSIGITIDNGPKDYSNYVAEGPIYCVTGGSTVRIDFFEGHR